jgi:hypothetical protein
MSWPGFYALSAAWFFLLIPPLVLLYFLKLKRPVLKVPSLALWAQVMQDKRVNSPFQKFKRNILLWLQLLILICLVLAAMLPFFRGGDSSSRVLLLLDCSASMGALDKRGGESRMALAKERASEVIEGLSPLQEAAIITFGRTARQAVPFTNSQRVLLAGLDKVEIQEVDSNIVDALRMADAMARSTPFDRVLLFSDGNLPGVVDFDLPFQLEFERLPGAGPNLGITGLRARRADDSGWSVFVRVQGSRDADIPCTLVVLKDGTELFSQPVHPGLTGQRFVFPVEGSGAAQLEFRLQPRGFDSLAVDNVAWLTLAEVRPLRVLVAGGLEFFEHALRVIRDVDVFTTARPEVTYDLVIAKDPDGVPEARTALHMGYVPGDLDGIVQVETLTNGTDSVVDWQRSNALLEHVEMGELFIGQRVAWGSGKQEAQLDNRRYEVLAYGENGPLIVQKEDGGLLRYHFLFDPARSTLPYRVGFPILCRNLVTVAMQRTGLLELDGPRTGVLPDLTLLPKTNYTILAPDGSKRQEMTDARGVLSGIPATRAGVYRVDRGGDVTMLSANLLSARETVLGSVDRLQLNELSVEAVEEEIATDQSLWSWLAGIAFFVLMLEWWVFQARPGGYAARRA